MAKNHLMTSMCILLGLGAGTLSATAAQAQELGNLYYYNLPSEELQNNSVAWKNFIAYENREPCQHYWAPPAGYVMKGCGVYSLVRETPTAAVEEKEQPVVSQETHKLLPVVASYTILFNYDRSNIRPDQRGELDRIATEIDKYKPLQVTVSGYTDTMGTAKYNMVLSQHRAKAVAAALTAEGVQNEVIDEQAHGKENLAVQTENGVKNQENRRAVVDFRR